MARGLPGAKAQPAAFAGSADWRSCHENSASWGPQPSTSFHGLAMRPYSDVFAPSFLTPQDQPLAIGEAACRVEIGPGQGAVVETVGVTETRDPRVQALGGKNVFSFLTPLDQGRFQTLPLVYDVRKEELGDMAASGAGHAPDMARPPTTRGCCSGSPIPSRRRPFAATPPEHDDDRWAPGI
jgi:hypothetical protein